MAVKAAPALGWGWHCKKCAKGFGGACSGHGSVSVASGCNPAGAVLRGEVIWGKKPQSWVILRNFCPVSHVRLKLSLARALPAASGWDEQIGGGAGFVNWEEK